MRAFIFVIALLIGIHSLAEYSGLGSSTAGGILGGRSLGDTTSGEVESGGSGVERKAEISEEKAKEANGVAMGTGAALMATGIPMALSPIIPVMVAGYELIAMGALEFAQAGADKSAAIDNGQLKDILTNQGRGEGGEQAKGSINNQDMINKILSPELEKFLGDRGINPEDFANRMLRGEIKDANDVAQSLGNSVPFSDADRIKGIALANDKFDELQSDVKEPNDKKLSLDERAPQSGSTSSGVNPGGAGGAFTMLGGNGNGNGNGKGKGEMNSDSVPKVEGHGALGTVGKGSQNGTEISQTAGNETPSISEAFKKFLSPEEQEKKAQILEAMGIKRGKTTQTIFQMATRQYRSFAKWRKTARFAAVWIE